ncbi:helix-turn-helix domain-containing protein [Pseudonocardia phyllosphaerae]|uniref:helix-turn-helix domain-containing protein n=1 Tax=Pseudonocardia phyllosphaerae TaxID=3390502 RepID=UPI00397A9D0A
MSKARLVITAVVLEGRSQSEVARAYGVSQSWISRLVARYRVEACKAVGIGRNLGVNGNTLDRWTYCLTSRPD